MTHCFRCGQVNAPNQKFCGECGVPLHGQARPEAGYTPPHLARGALSYRFALEGERKLVTVMFCDIANSTEIAARVGAEAMHQRLNRFFELTLAKVHRYEGTVNQFLGDGFMALFGAPIAHEDHARRALLAAMAIQQEMRNDAQGADAMDPFQLRIGLNTGMVVVGKIGDNLRMDYTAIGDTTNLAARLQSHAEPGSIRTSDSTRRAAEANFDFADLGRHAIKGIAEPVAIFAPLGARSARSAAAGAAGDGSVSQLVGREVELAAFARSLSDLAAGHGSVVVLRGEPGMGKSRVLAEARQHGAARQVLWLEGCSVSFGQGLTHWPFIEILRTVFAIDESDSEATALQKLEHGARDVFDAQANEILPYLAMVLALCVPAEHEQRVKFLDAQAIKRQVFLTMRQLFERLAQRQPTLVVLEDWHWVDQSSIALCEHLLPLVSSAPLSFWFTTRTEASEAVARVKVAATEAALRVDDLTLSPLSAGQTQQLIGCMVGAGTLPEAVRERIQRRTEGNPFFIEEVVRAFTLDAQPHADTRAPAAHSTARPITDLSIPDSVQAVILARVDRLDEDAKGVLKLASVIGRTFLLRVLKAIARAAETVEPGVERLQENELIHLRQRAPDVEYIFKHALVQEATYGSILAERRRSVHRQVAQAIETLFADRIDEYTSLLAHHYAQAEDWPKANAFLLAAGDQAGRIAADAEALEHYRQAVASQPKAAAAAMTPLQRATLDRKLGQAFYGIGNYQEAVAHFSRALAHLGIAYPDRHSGARRAIIKHVLAHFLRRGLGRFGSKFGVDEAREASAICEAMAWLDYYADEDRFALDSLIALDVGERSGDLESQARGLATLGFVLLSMGLHRLAWRRIGESMAIADRIQVPTIKAGAPFVRGWFLWTRGQIDHAMVSLEASASLYRSIGDLRGWAGALSTLGWVLARRGEFERARRVCEEVVRIGEGANDLHLAAWGSVCLGHLCSTIGPLERASPYLETVRDLSKRSSEMRMHANAGGVLAKSLLRRGLIAEARAILAEALETLEARAMRDMFYIEPITAFIELCLHDASQSSGAQRRSALAAARSACNKALRCSRRSAAAWQPEAMRLHGTLAWLDGNSARALQRWRQSIQAADAMKLPVDRARALLEIGERTRDEAPVMEAQRIFEQTGAQVDLAFSLHVLARGAAERGADRIDVQRRYDEAIAALRRVGAESAAALAVREREALPDERRPGDESHDTSQGQLSIVSVTVPSSRAPTRATDSQARH
jgi:class 3 adenylate cyclase/tetratricopeptide (TPR) repeat protein